MTQKKNEIVIEVTDPDFDIKIMKAKVKGLKIFLSGKFQFFSMEIEPFLGKTKLDKKTYLEIMPTLNIRALFSDLTWNDIHNAPHWKDIKTEKEAELGKKLDQYTMTPHLRAFKYFRTELNGADYLLKPFNDEFFLGFRLSNAKMFLKSSKKIWKIADCLNQLLFKKSASTYSTDNGERITHYEKHKGFNNISINTKEIIEALGLTTDDYNVYWDIKNAVSFLYNMDFVSISGGWGSESHLGSLITSYKHLRRYELKNGIRVKSNKSSKYIFNFNSLYYEGIVPDLDKSLTKIERKGLFAQRQYFTTFEISKEIQNQLTGQELSFLRYLEGLPDLCKIRRMKSDVKFIKRPIDEVNKYNGYHYKEKYRQTKKTIEVLIKFKKLGIVKKTLPAINDKTKKFITRTDTIEITTVKNQ